MMIATAGTDSRYGRALRRHEGTSGGRRPSVSGCVCGPVTVVVIAVSPPVPGRPAYVSGVDLRLEAVGEGVQAGLGVLAPVDVLQRGGPFLGRLEELRGRRELDLRLSDDLVERVQVAREADQGVLE